MSEVASLTAGQGGNGEALPHIQEGVFVGPEPDGGLSLVGSICAGCGQKMFPVRARCVSCFGGRLDEHRFEPFDDVSIPAVDERDEGRAERNLHRPSALRSAAAIRPISPELRNWCVGRLIPRCAHSSATG